MTGVVATKVMKLTCGYARIGARPESLLEEGKVTMNSENNTRLQWSTFYRLFLAALLLLCLVKPGLAQSSESAMGQERRSLKGPDAVKNRIESDRAATDTPFEWEAMKPYYDWKDHIHEKYGYTFGVSYISVFAKASDSLPDADDYASSAVLRLSGIWEALGRGTDTTGTLSYMVEHRHRYADTSLSPFHLANLGNVGVTSVPFEDDGWHLTHLIWDQSWQNGRFEIFAGFIDVTDFVDVYPLTSFWTDFSNYVFSVGVATIDLPDDAALGLAAGTWLTDSIYIMASIEDLNSDPNDPFEGFDTFFNDNEYFTHIELGWTASAWESYYLDNLHITLWHADEREEQAVDDGWGAVLSFTHTISEKWLMFARGGFAEDGGSLLERSVSLGGGYTPAGLGALGADDQLGFGVNWGRPNKTVLGHDLDDQYSIEAYYRWQLTKGIAITPDVQLLINPALNPDEDTIWVFGLRARLAL